MNRQRAARRAGTWRRRVFAAGTAAVALVCLSVGWLEISSLGAPRAAHAPVGGSGPSGSSRMHANVALSRRPRAHGGTTRRDRPDPAQMPPLGVYTGPGSASSAEAVAAQLAGKVRYALDFLPRTSWTALTDPTWVAQSWRGAPFELVLGVPMLPNTGGTLAQGASGAFDTRFQLLAQRLVADGLGASILMLGYQPDDAGTPWYAGTPAAARAYVRFWDAIASTMSAVVGAAFTYEWDAGDAGTSPVSPAAMYPGNGAVDIVATDAFDFVGDNPATAGHWSTVLDERFGPAWMASFAAAHHKPMAIAMWGEVPSSLGGAGDDPGYVSQLLQWATSEHLAMCVLWDSQALALTNGSFPLADAALREALVPR